MVGGGGSCSSEQSSDKSNYGGNLWRLSQSGKLKLPVWGVRGNVIPGLELVPTFQQDFLTRSKMCVRGDDKKKSLSKIFVSQHWARFPALQSFCCRNPDFIIAPSPFQLCDLLSVV